MQKIKSQINILFKITEFIWNLFLIQTCQVYTAIIRSALIYKILAWYQSHQQSFSMLKLIKVEIMTKLTKQQNMCFWLIIDIYKIILLIILKAEMYISSLNLHLNSVIFWTLKRIKKSSMTCQIKVICTVIRKKLHQRKQNY